MHLPSAEALQTTDTAKHGPESTVTLPEEVLSHPRHQCT